MLAKEQKNALSLASRSLKLAGTALITITLINFILLLVPPNFGDVTWWLNLISQIVQQGIVPLIGLGLLFGGVGFELISSPNGENERWIAATKTFGFRMAGVFALLFLVLVPAHAISAVAASQQTIERIDREQDATFEQIDLQLQQQQRLYANLIESDADLDVAIEDLVGDTPLTEEQLAQLRKFRDDPDALDRQIQALQAQLVERVQEQNKEAKEASKFGVWKSIARFGLTSLLLATCYFNIARLGFTKKPKRPKVKRRQPEPEPKPKSKSKSKRPQKPESRQAPPPPNDDGFLP